MRGHVRGLSDEKKKKRRERVFRSALDLFEKKGFTATTMREIAEKSDLAVGTLYNYFPSKNRLLLEFMAKKIEEISLGNRRSIVRIFREETNSRVIVEKIFRLVMDDFFIMSKQNWYEVLTAFFSASKDLEMGINLDEENIRLIENIVWLMQKRGLIESRFSAHAIAFNFYSIVMTQFMSYIIFPEMNEEEFFMGISEQLELVFEGIGGGS
jgi:AcrR family transcriptional regulator